jgi:hypothetical protein
LPRSGCKTRWRVAAGKPFLVLLTGAASVADAGLPLQFVRDTLLNLSWFASVFEWVISYFSILSQKTGCPICFCVLSYIFKKF